MSLFFAGLAAHQTMHGAPHPPPGSSLPCLQASQMVALADSLRSASGIGDSYAAAVRLAFSGAETLTAFEENRSFVYALGESSDGSMRRLIILKPSVLLVGDEAAPGSQAEACLYSEKAPEMSGGRVRVIAGEDEITWETKSALKVTAGTAKAGGYIVQAASPASPTSSRAFHLFYVEQKGHTVSAAHPTVAFDADHPWMLTISASNHLFRFWLPMASAGAGEVEISAPDGKVQVNRRPLPSGILPHGSEGNRLLESWDSDYRREKPPPWDIGRPADELQKVVKEGTIRKCRVVDLGCGSGTDAIFLARQGFDVTGIDISPTALGQAEEKARKAGISVRWVLADVTAPPKIGPYDFIYDRGCYHNVRDQNLEAYIETVRRFSHAGTKLLVLSARRDERSPARSSGVSEEELRFDFSPFFEVEWLREIMLETNEAQVAAPGWSALLRRNGKP